MPSFNVKSCRMYRKNSCHKKLFGGLCTFSQNVTYRIHSTEVAGLRATGHFVHPKALRFITLDEQLRKIFM